ncbi:hypothetical protein EUGRSUZ_C00217 [Eucalyptus grandis]|uniref:Uncharacterized protein n=2 Tax=Eucalyptus grandis TaxID=71139 RepID=A0ACC3L9Y1_EUCGR|nr:hypothetical protein EUGRSUZ_C00217 [Eucalyptus grandis]
MAMFGLQFSYAALTLFARASFLQGVSPRVFVVYRQATATLSFHPVAISQNIYYEGSYLASSSIASATNNLVPATTFLMASAIGSLRKIAKILGTTVCVSGAIVMVLLRGPKLLNAEFHLSASSIFDSEGDGSTWKCLLLVPMSASHPDHLSLSDWICFMSTTQCAVITLFLEQDPDAWRIHSKLGIAAILYSGTVGSGISFFVQSCLAGAIEVVAGLYLVLWGIAKDIEIIEETDPKLQFDCAPTVKPSADESLLEKPSSCKSQLSEPLLSDKSADEISPV